MDASLAHAPAVETLKYQREDDDQAVEKLREEASQARCYNAGLDEGDNGGADSATEDRADAAPGWCAADE